MFIYAEIDFSTWSFVISNGTVSDYENSEDGRRV